MKRYEDWEARLDAFFTETQTCAQEWGKDDCAMRACNAVLAITGVDLAEPFRGTYATELGAARAIKKFCGGGLEQLADKVAKQHGIDECPVFRARRGDVVLIGGDNPTLGVVSLDGWNILTTATGYTLENCKRAWRIG